MQNPDDINRDIFKSDTCKLVVPEIELELQPGTLGSVYTTVEGILTKILEQLEETNPFGHGDSSQGTEFRDFLNRIRVLKEG